MGISALTTVTDAVQTALAKTDDPQLKARVDEVLPLRMRHDLAELSDFKSRLPATAVEPVQLNLQQSLSKLQSDEVDLPIRDRQIYLRSREALRLLHDADQSLLPQEIDASLFEHGKSGPTPVGEVEQNQDFIRKVDGRYVAVLSSSFPVKNVTVEQVAPLLDPLNWPVVTDFFREMVAQDPPVNNDGWSRVLETVGTDDFRISTALKYWKGEADGCAFINYDLDDENKRAGDEGWAIVDNGFLIVCPEGDGVRVEVSKNLLVHGLSPTASAVLARSVHWEAIALDVFDQEEHPDKPRPPLRAKWSVSKPLPAKKQVKIPDVELPKPELLPSRTRGALVGVIQDQANSFLTGSSPLMDQLFTSWSDGLTVGDVSALTGKVGEFVNNFAQESLSVSNRLFLADKKD